LIKINLPGASLSEKHQNALVRSGAPGAFILGIIFALAFCPVSAALFFGSLIPLALNSKTGTMLPFIYGIGTGLPVLIFSFGITLGITSLSHWFHKVVKFEIYARKITGAIFIAAGIYYFSAYMR
jgi:cytochrome c-type biogenesis protein